MIWRWLHYRSSQVELVFDGQNGRSRACVFTLFRGCEVVGSNPVIPTRKEQFIGLSGGLFL